MNIVQKYATKNRCYQTARTISVRGLMLHSIGTPQPNADSLANYYNQSVVGGVCVHGFIDGNDGHIVQTLPWNYRAGHCGSGSNGSCNNTHIAIEMCETSHIKYTSGAKFYATDLNQAKKDCARSYNTAVELFAYLCKQFNLNPLQDGVILSHNEGHKRGVASGHVDPEHYWDGLGMGYTMNQFRQDVYEKMNGKQEAANPTPTPTQSPKEDSNHIYRIRKTWDDAKSQIGAYSNLENAKAACPANYTVFDENGNRVYGAFSAYTIKVTAKSGLNVRANPNGTSTVMTTIPYSGVYTIVDEKNGWGLLKAYQTNRNGWISLQYTKKV